MPRPRPSRSILLLVLLLPVALVAILALWLRDGDDDSVSAPSRFSASTEQDVPALLPRATGVASAEPLPDDSFGVEQESEGEAVAHRPALAHLGSLGGRLLDAAGEPVAGEPVFLVRDRDPWRRGVPSRDDVSPLAKLIDSGRSDSQGRFTLGADPGVTYQLFAGGTAWARVDVGTVVAGDELSVVLREGFVLTGTLRDARNQAPLADGWVLALADDCSQLARTAEDGSFRIGPVPELVSIVGAYATGYDVALSNEVLPSDGVVQLELVASAPAAGRLVDSRTKQPLAGGQVRLLIDVTAQMTGDGSRLPDHIEVDPVTVEVDADGRFALTSAPARGFLLEASSPGYVPARIETWREQTRPVDGELVLSLDPVQPIEGRAIVGDTGSPAAGAEIAGAGLNGPFGAVAADSDGDFALDTSGWDGEKPVYLSARDAAGRTARERVGGRDDAVLLELVPPMTIAVQVVRSGSPVVGAPVAALSDGALATQATSDAEGRATLLHELAGPDASRVVVQARWGNAQSVPVELPVAAGSPRDPVVLDLDVGERLQGSVLDDHGLPVPSALISAVPHPKDASTQRPVAHADDQGEFELGPLTAGLTWDLRIEAEGFHQSRLTEVSPLGGPLLVTLQPVVRWEGTVADGVTGRPVTDFQGQLLKEVSENGVVSFKNTRESVRRTPGRPGAFSVTLPEAGTFQLRMMARDCLPADSAPVVFAGAGVAPPPAQLLLWPAAVLEVAVRDGRGRPVRGFEVTAVAWDGSSAEGPSPEARKAAARQSTNDEGLARFNLGQGGAYRVGGGPGAWLDGQRIQVAPGDSVYRQYTLPATGDLEISVFDENGQPLAGVQVEVRSAKSEQAHTVLRRTGNRGGSSAVVVEGLPVGRYTIRLRRRGYTAEPSEASVRANALERVDLDMKPPAKAPAPPVKG